MRVGVVTIQKNRAPWIAEWLAFHKVAGFSKFYFYAHNCTDNTAEVVNSLQDYYDIKSFSINANQNGIQLSVYQHAYENFGHECDWLAFIDGDEFLFPSQAPDIGSALDRFNYEKISALGVYWVCFGSSDHLLEPPGLVTKNYRQRYPLEHKLNRHIKSIVRGRQNSTVSQNAHMFNTPYGTFDENLRPITFGLTDYHPVYEHFRINHYICQSYEFFKQFKQRSGAADAGRDFIRPDEWWSEMNINAAYDHSIEPWYEKLDVEMNRIGFGVGASPGTIKL